MSLSSNFCAALIPHFQITLKSWRFFPLYFQFSFSLSMALSLFSFLSSYFIFSICLVLSLTLLKETLFLYSLHIFLIPLSITTPQASHSMLLSCVALTCFNSSSAHKHFFSSDFYVIVPPILKCIPLCT